MERPTGEDKSTLSCCFVCSVAHAVKWVRERKATPSRFIGALRSISRRQKAGGFLSLGGAATSELAVLLDNILSP